MRLALIYSNDKTETSQYIKSKYVLSATEEDIVNVSDLCPSCSGKLYYLCHGNNH